MGFASLRVSASEAGREIPLGPFAGLVPVDVDSPPVQLLALVRRAIGSRGDGSRVVLLVDDAHLLDAASATLVQQLAGARGDGARHAQEWRARARRGGLAVEGPRLRVPGAAAALLEEAALIESLIAGEVDAQTKHRLWEASRGVPLLVRELVLDGLERQRLIEHRALALARRHRCRRPAPGADPPPDRPARVR